MDALTPTHAKSADEALQWEQTFDIELSNDDTLDYQLSPPVFLNTAEAHKYSPRDLVTERELLAGRFYLQVRCQRPKFGVYQDRPACLIILDHAFQNANTKSRFKSAQISIFFEDASVIYLDPNDDDNDDAFEAARPHRPKVLEFQPMNYMRHAPSTPTAKGSITATLGISSAGLVPGIPVPELSAEVEAKRPFVKEGFHSITGVTKGASQNLLSFALAENTLSKSGVIPRLSTPVIVSYTPGRKFAARVKVQAVLEGRFTGLVQGKKDDPLMFGSLLSMPEERVDLKKESLKELFHWVNRGDGMERRIFVYLHTALRLISHHPTSGTGKI
ncbi:uncharacterized protein BDR25DRAFT_360901 [Lindgomyces ingoldianus]|uniref:Uncharacterized protein n=1 Tax=Lindgomyces ingoldianus TaxID=673940 RepID=A0ACB6QF64_9PLEO|nr:uncharacterized protein BDR25DRAFT_360901 [Lindgomyces ingoldianus]KAF2464997.1 hypothetical protein BDR25DRAFT_360901 [Lindgomyces ingoldianus]